MAKKFKKLTGVLRLNLIYNITYKKDFVNSFSKIYKNLYKISCKNSHARFNSITS